MNVGPAGGTGDGRKFRGKTDPTVDATVTRDVCRSLA
jgi:hypothetical protein